MYRPRAAILELLSSRIVSEVYFFINRLGVPIDYDQRVMFHECLDQDRFAYFFVNYTDAGYISEGQQPLSQENPVRSILFQHLY